MLTNAKGRSNAASSQDVLKHCESLKESLHKNKSSVLDGLRRDPADDQPSIIFAAWLYALETIILQARRKEICVWFVEGLEDKPSEDEDSSDGEITLRRV